MKNIIFLLLIFSFSACNKPKTVMICGDHVCVNKAEAKQFFNDNLTLEVKILDTKIKDKSDLVELNLKTSSSNQKEISIFSKKKTDQNIKILSNKEIEQKKLQLKERKKVKRNKQKNEKVKKKQKILKSSESAKVISKQTNQIVDVCMIIEKCNIEEISKYLVKQGKNKKFPDITLRGE
tara:strand:- start:12 stop:548 length:537 start_codon:yes stop_codon:yes gene_type:complete